MKKQLLLRSLFTVGISIIYAFSQVQLTVSALSLDQKTQQTRGAKYTDVATCDTSGSSGGGGGTVSADGETTDPPSAVKKVLWDTLTSGGIDDIHVAAIMGSIDNEGGFDPMNTGYVPGNYDGKDPDTQKAHDEGYGLIGWTPGHNLIVDMGKLGLKDEKPYTAETQSKVILGYLQPENKTGRYSKSDVDGFLNAKTLSEASKNWVGGDGWGFERPKVVNADELQQRLNSATTIYKQFSGKAPSTPTGGGSSSTSCCPASGSSDTTTTLTGDSEEEQVFNYFYSTKGIDLVQVAALMGNLSVESGFSPTIYNVNHHTNDPKSADGYAWGLVQWLPPEKVLDEQTKSGVKGDIYKLSVQLDITWWEMKNSAPASGAGFLGGFNKFKNESQLGDAVTYWQQYFEGSLGQGDSERATAAQEIYNKYKDAIPSPDPGTGGGTTTASGSCSCTESTGSGSGTIVLDPGHSTFSDQSSQDSLTGLYDTDTTGGPNEMHDAWVAANKIKTLLEDKGYTVVLTKKSENESISLSQRAERANKTKGALLFTMHADSSVRWLAYPDKNSDREPGTGSRRDGTNGLVHPDIAKPSEDFAKTMAPIIAKGISKGGDAYDATSFADYYGAAGIPGNGLNKGNTPVQTILSSIPEVYSEVSPTDLPSDDFAKAAADAITTVVKPSGGDAGSDSGSGGCVGSGAVAGDLQATVKNYAWPNYSHVRTDPVPAFKEAIDTAESQGQYVGEKYTDCGGFVTRAMIDSGFEPNYNYSGKISKGALNTPIQMEWLQANWQKINPSDTSDLQPGDVAISSSHTFMYVGHIDGFNGAFASASQGTRVPMASSDSLSGYNWFRRK